MRSRGCPTSRNPLRYWQRERLEKTTLPRVLRAKEGKSRGGEDRVDKLSG